MPCPARHSPHSEVGSEQPHGRCGLQFPHLSQPRPASPQGPRRPPERVPGPSRTRAPRTPAVATGTPRGRNGARPPPTAHQGGRALGAGTRLDRSCSGSWRRDRPHPARPAHCLGFPPLNWGAPDLGRPRSPSSRPQGPTCAVARTVDRSAPGTPALHRAAACASDGGDCGDVGGGGLGGGGKRAGGRAEGWLLPPARDRRFLSSLGPSHTRAAPRGSQTAAQKVLLFTWTKPTRGSEMGQCGRGTERLGASHTLGVKSRVDKRGTSSYQVG